MLIEFFLKLKEGGVPVSIKEFLVLMEAFQKHVIFGSVEDFYHLARTCMVKDEKYFDRYDRVFAAYFKGIVEVDVLAANLPEEWLRKLAEKILTDEEKKLIESLGGWEKLMETLRKLEVESRTLFEQTFAEARKNFQEIFRKLFQGGKADMFLGESEDLLEAGIEIVAQPPGKQLQSINLLSGGERSLTAVAFLVALFKARPSPFYVMDEVEAALDDVNLGRLIDLISELKSSSQLIVITHQKRTMEIADALYGVTMRGDGVTQVISQRLQKVSEEANA